MGLYREHIQRSVEHLVEAYQQMPAPENPLCDVSIGNFANDPVGQISTALVSLLFADSHDEQLKANLMIENLSRQVGIETHDCIIDPLDIIDQMALHLNARGTSLDQNSSWIMEPERDLSKFKKKQYRTVKIDTDSIDILDRKNAKAIQTIHQQSTRDRAKTCIDVLAKCANSAHPKDSVAQFSRTIDKAVNLFQQDLLCQKITYEFYQTNTKVHTVTGHVQEALFKRAITLLKEIDSQIKSVLRESENGQLLQDLIQEKSSWINSIVDRSRNELKKGSMDSIVETDPEKHNIFDLPANVEFLAKSMIAIIAEDFQMDDEERNFTLARILVKLHHNSVGNQFYYSGNSFFSYSSESTTLYLQTVMSEHNNRLVAVKMTNQPDPEADVQSI